MVSSPPNPYEAPASNGDTASRPSEGGGRSFNRSFVWIPFAAWTVALCLIQGAAGIVGLVSDLRQFGGLEYVARAVALNDVRVGAGQLTATSAAFAVVTACHRSGAAPRSVLERWSEFGRVLLAVPFVTPPSAALLFGASMAVGIALGIPPASVSAGVASISVSDVAYGLATACVHAVIAGVVLTTAAGVLLRPRSLVARSVLTWLVVTVAFTALHVVALVIQSLRPAH